MAKIDFKENISIGEEVNKTVWHEHLSANAGELSLELPDRLVSPSRLFESLYHAVATKLSDEDLKRMARMSEDADCQSVNNEHIFDALASGYAETSDSKFSGYEVAKLLWGASSAIANIRALNIIATDAQYILTERAAKKSAEKHH